MLSTTIVFITVSSILLFSMLFFPSLIKTYKVIEYVTNETGLRIYHFSDMLTGFINPEYGAMKTIVQFATTLK